jgi:hypothetical protein
MTTGINPDVGPIARRWATRLLGVDENASRAEARRAYFKMLRKSDFLPPRSLPHALRILDGKRGPAELDEEWLLAEEGRLRADVESFAAEFFTLPATQRRERWDALFSRCETVSPLTARLQALKAGLDVEVKSLPSFHGLLAEQLLQSFPLAPLAQAASRQAFLREIEEPSAGDHASWEKAARYLLAEWPALASLDREFVQHVAKLRSRVKRKRSMQQRNQRQREAMHLRSMRQRLAPVAAGKKRSAWWVLAISVSMLGMVIRGITSYHSSPPVAPSPSYSPDSSVRSVLTQQPPIDDLLDPSKYDIEILGQAPSRILHFTPRPHPTTTGPNGSQPNNHQLLVYEESYFRLMGVSQEQINVLVSRAAEKRPDGVPKTPGEVGPKPPKSTPGNSTRP